MEFSGFRAIGRWAMIGEGSMPEDRPTGPSWTIGDERIRRLEARSYPGYIDEHERFDALVREYLRPGCDMLDAGAGRGTRYPNRYRDIAARVAGVDLDEAVLSNANLTDAVVADLADMPYDDGSFDLTISKYVFEHLRRPDAVMRELRRVLKPGGHLVIQTPNRWHYMAVVARATPTGFHVWCNRHRGCEAVDTFPTFYRANDRRSLARLARAGGFRVVRLSAIETKPDYLFFHPIAYRAGVAYERLVNRSESLSGLRVQLFVVLQATG
jgi:SAM-dependent methyltransferase